MDKKSLRFRHVHLDFHNSQHIGELGIEFRKHEFQEVLGTANIDSINLFARCHHGYSYHPTNVGVMHPGLEFDLLGEQVSACREMDVSVVLYVSVGWDEHWACSHPEHVVVPPKGTDPFHVGYHRIGFHDRYLDYLCGYVTEVVQQYEPDGLWFDIVAAVPDVSALAQSAMRRKLLDPTNAVHRKRHAVAEQHKYLNRIGDLIANTGPDLRVFHNAGHTHKGDRQFLNYVTHLEVESLPTGGWGYDHFPLSAKYVSSLKDVEFLGMTGKFHTTWGEFGGFKHPNALRYECALMMAFGARCSIGDQLHPMGRLDADTYERIGIAYCEVQRKQRYCENARPVSDIAVLSIEAIEHVHPHNTWLWQWGRDDFPSDSGVGRMLLEKQVMFDVIDTAADFSEYSVIIIPDFGRFNEQLAEKVTRFLNEGGKLVLSHESGMDLHKDTFQVNLGTVVGRSKFDPEYLRVVGDLAETDNALVKCPIVIPGNSVQLVCESSELIAENCEPYFNRTLEHFHSHQHSPAARTSPYPAVLIANDNILYFANAIFSAYANRGQYLYRELFYSALELLSPVSTCTSMQSSGRLSLMEQPDQSRYVLHLLYVQPIRRGDDLPDWQLALEVVEDVNPIFDIDCKVRIARRPTLLRLPLDGDLEIPFEVEEDGDCFEVSFRIPRVELHQIVLICYSECSAAH